MSETYAKMDNAQNDDPFRMSPIKLEQVQVRGDMHEKDPEQQNLYQFHGKNCF